MYVMGATENFLKGEFILANKFSCGKNELDGRKQGNRGKTISIMQARSDVGIDHSEAARREIQLF